MKKKISIFILLLTCCFCFGNNKIIRKDQIGDSQKAFRNALYSFDSKDYGKALKYAEDSILFRRQEIEYEIYTLKESLSSRAVHSAGDNIQDILKLLTERKENETIKIINKYIKKNGIDYFDNSITKLLEYMEAHKVFPEADKLIGDIYKLEGEYHFAEEYYLKALANKDVLNIPSEKYEILYMLAEISEFEKDYDKFEVRLLNVLAEDENYKNDSLRKAMCRTISTNNKKSVEKLFKLYRADSFQSLNAYIKLANYYYDIDEIDRALEFSALAVITSFTKINITLESRNTEYKASSLDIFLQECSFYSDIVQWGASNMVWSSFTLLAKISLAKGYNNFASEYLKSLVKYLPEPYWQKDAVLVLESLQN